MNGSNRTPVAEGEIHHVEIEDYGDEGDGIARIDGYVVFVPNTQVEDEVWIVITDVGNRSGRGYQVELPSDTSLPFFAYGIFRRDEIGYHRIHDYVETDAGNTEVQDAAVRGDLLVEDGMALLIPLSQAPEHERTVTGSIIPFTNTTGVNGYAMIAASEPMTHYSWMQVQTTDDTVANALVTDPEHDIKNISGKQFHPHETKVRWHSRSYFEDIMPVVHEVFEHNQRLRDINEFFRLQMGYLLLWSALERYISLAWGKSIWEPVKEKRERFANNDDGFAQGVTAVFEEGVSKAYRTLSRSDDPTTTIELEVGNPETIINYLYQVRSNVTHRGKGEPTADEELLCQSFYDLYHIFSAVLEHRYTNISIPIIQSEPV